MVVIEMNPRVSQLGTRFEGHRISYREDRRKTGRRVR